MLTGDQLPSHAYEQLPLILPAAVQPGQSGGCREHLAGQLAVVLRVWNLTLINLVRTRLVI
jgi:hypothetical protein